MTYRYSSRLAATLTAVLMQLPMTVAAQTPTAGPSPVATARNGFTPAQARDLMTRYSYEEVLKFGDVALFFALNPETKLGMVRIPRAGNVVMLDKRIDPAIGRTRVKGEFGELPLVQFLTDPRSRAQGMIVVHKGRIVFEEYPGMREFDHHVWFSVTKTAASLVVRQLAEQGRIDVSRPIDSYVPELRGSAWAGVSVLNVLDMAAGLDNVETAELLRDPRSIAARHNFAANGVPNADGKIERAIDVVLATKRVGPAGQAFDYSSVNTLVLGLLAEAVESKRWTDIFRERVWSKMTVEGDALMNVASDGVAHAEGMMITRLRDLARYGMLYTPSWSRAAREKVVSDAYIRQIQTGGRKENFLRGEQGKRMVQKSFPASPPVANSWQWDAVFADGDFYKGGSLGQGLYVSPGRDLVICWFSTVASTDLTQYARAIARAMPAAK